jgi:hypothetical protein
MSEQLESDQASGFKGIFLSVTKAVSVIAGVVFFLMPIRTFTQVFLCLGSFLVFVVCSAVSGNFENKGIGYWPDKPEYS